MTQRDGVLSRFCVKLLVGLEAAIALGEKWFS
jgi:hypothetical protein